MDTATKPRTLRVFSLASIFFGALGGAFYWWVPMGIVLSLTGLVLGFTDVLLARRRSLSYRLSVAGLIISAATLCLGIVIAALGLQTVTFGR